MEKPERDILVKNWSIFVAVASFIFALGKLYSDNTALKHTVDILSSQLEEHKRDATIQHNLLQEKQDRKWGDIPEIEQRVDDLEEYRAYQDGFSMGKKEKK